VIFILSGVLHAPPYGIALSIYHENRRSLAGKGSGTEDL